MEQYSVLMSVYAGEKAVYFREAVRSMMEQSISPDQIVIVKDGCLPSELDNVITELSLLDPDLFTIVSLPENVGLGRALDIGMEKCRNELIARMDSDDISLPLRCEKQLECFWEDETLDIVGTYISEFEEDPQQVRTIRIVPETHDEILKFSRRRQPFNHPTVMYKKSAVLRCGGYGSARRKEDLYLFLAMLNNGCKAKNIAQSLLYYRADKQNLKRRKNWTNCKESIQAFYHNFRYGNSSLVDFCVVFLAELAFFVMPEGVAKVFSDCFLRKKVKPM